MFKCKRCLIKQDESAFAWRCKAKGKRNYWCRTCVSAYNLNHHLKNKAENRARVAAWAIANKERLAQRKLDWARANPMKRRLSDNKRRAHLSVVPRDLTHKDWLAILATFGNACAYCLRDDVPMTVDHIEPVSKGGSHTANNVVPACSACNSSKCDRGILYMLRKLFANRK